MSELRALIQHEIDRAEPRPYSFEAFQDRRQKEARRHRAEAAGLGLVLAVVVIASLIAVLQARQKAGTPATVPITQKNVSELRPYWLRQTGGAINAAPTVVGDRVYVANTGGTVLAFPTSCSSAPGTCAPIWTAQYNPASTFGIGSPAVGDGMVFVGNLEGTLLGYPTSCASTCAPTWIATGMGDLSEASPVVADGVVYAGSTDGKLYAFATGCTSYPHPCPRLWSARLKGGFAVGGYAGAGPTVSDGVVYVGSTAGTFYSFPTSCDAGSLCRPLHAIKLPGVLSDPIVVSQDTVFVTSGRAVYAFSRRCLGAGGNCDPTLIGRAPDLILSPPAVGEGYVYVGSVGGVVSAFPICHGCAGEQPAWSIPHLGRFPNPNVFGGVLYVATMGSTDTLKAFDARCGISGGACRPLLRYVTDGFVQQQVIPQGSGTIFAATGDSTGGDAGGDLYAFRIGAPATRLGKAVGDVHSGPPVGSWMYVGFYLVAAGVIWLAVRRRRAGHSRAAASAEDAPRSG